MPDSFAVLDKEGKSGSRDDLIKDAVEHARRAEQHEGMPARVVELLRRRRPRDQSTRVAEPAGDDPTERPGRQRDVRRDATQYNDAALQQEDRDVELEHIIPTAERLDQYGCERQ